MITNEIPQIQITSYNKSPFKENFDFDQIIYDLDCQIDLLSSHADNLDYIVSMASGILCASLDILWVGDFNLVTGRELAGEKAENFVMKVSKFFGCKDNDISSCVKFLEEKFPLASDGNINDFGGGLQHHLRDFSHHPTIIGLIFSLLTQFTKMSYGTDSHGVFIVKPVPASSLKFIGKDTPTRILFGTVKWFFHLVSDLVGSGATAGLSGGTGLPGPILSLAKEVASIPSIQNSLKDSQKFSIFLSKLFNGTFFAKRDTNGKIIKETVLRFDLRTELGISMQIGKQALPVIANDCIVRTFYFIRRFAIELKKNNCKEINDIKNLNWNNIKPTNNPTIDRMLLISSGVFTAIDISDAVVAENFWISVNYVGIGRFAVAIQKDVSWSLKRRNIKKIKEMYENIKWFVYKKESNQTKERTQKSMDSMDINIDKLALTVEQTEILYNIEYYLTLNDINTTKTVINTEPIKSLKKDWLEEWQSFITEGFSTFLQTEGIEMHWYSEDALLQKIEQSSPQGTWFRLVLLEAMLFEPYFPMTVEQDKKGNDIPSPKYKDLQVLGSGYKEDNAATYLENIFSSKSYYTRDFVKRVRKSFNKALRDVNEVVKNTLTTIAIMATLSIPAIALAQAYAASIAVFLVGSKFAGLSGAALTSACLAYLGGGAIAVGGAGMAGGTLAIVGGGAVLGIGAGASAGGITAALKENSKKYVIKQSAKLLVTIQEIFLNDEHDIEYAQSIYQQYVHNIVLLEKDLVDLKSEAFDANDESAKKIKVQIKNLEDTIDAMQIARKCFQKILKAGINEKNRSFIYSE